jgi:hypothetical protein
MAMCDGAVFMAAVFLFFLQALCGCLHWYFCGLFLYFVLLDGFLINRSIWIQNFPDVFLPFVVNENQLFTSCCHC